MTYTNDRRTSFAPALLALVFLVNLAPHAAGRATPPVAPASPNPKTISIAEARTLPLGSVVTIDGSVTVAVLGFDRRPGNCSLLHRHVRLLSASRPLLHQARPLSAFSLLRG